MRLAIPGRYPPVDMAMDRYERETTRLISCLVKPDMVVLDIGAHVGYYSLLAARRVGPNGKVYAFEPEPGNYDLLVENIEQNGYENVIPFRQAISDRKGNSTLFLTSLDNGRHSLYHHGLPESGHMVVETTTVDAFLESKGWPQVGLVKVDVEGAESEVLGGMGGLLERSSRIKLIIEFNPSLLCHAGVDLVEFLKRPTNLGFKVQCIDEKQGLLPVESGDISELTQRLMKRETSINMLWSKE